MESVKGEKWEAFRDRHGDRGRDMVLYLGRKLIEAREYATVAMAVKRFEMGLKRSKKLPEEQDRVMQMSTVKM